MFVNRSTSVVASTSAPQREYGTPKTVESILEVRQFLVKFCDDSGAVHVDMLMQIGDRLYASPVGEEWCARLAPVTKWLGTEVLRRVSAGKKDIAPPPLDSVDVTGSRLAEATRAVVERMQNNGG